MTAGILVLSGFNNRAVIALCRWANSRKIGLHIVSASQRDAIYRTDYRKSVFVQRTHSHLFIDDVTRWIRTLKARYAYSSIFIAPSSEFINRFLLEHRAPLERAGAIIPLVDEDLYCSISNKQTFGQLCVHYGIPIPKELSLSTTTFPFVAKPRAYASTSSSNLSTHLIYDASCWMDFTSTRNLPDYYFQEFVSGRSIYLLAHISKARRAITCAQENLLQQARGGSIILARSDDFDRHRAAQAYLHMLFDIGFHGLIMIEVRLCQVTGRHLMIEANPRMWGPMQFVLDRRVDLLTALLADYGFQLDLADEQNPEQDYYFWSGGLSAASQPYVWHNYTSENFVNDYKRFAAADLFCRADTLNLYQDELSERWDG